MKETRTMEYKEKVTNTFLKTVSAYSNYGTGQIVFGINDVGEVVGLDDPEKTCLDVENKINDSISPKPNYTLRVTPEKTVVLEVKEGLDKPYLYRGKAYKRNDTSSIEVSRGELNRLTLQGTNQSFDEQTSSADSLSFEQLTRELQEKIGIEAVTKDILKSLNLYSDRRGYNHAAELLADENTFPGIDMIRFGKSINEIMDRRTIKHCSLLTQYHEAIKEFQKYYEYEMIEGSQRQVKWLIPMTAFREAVANALVHRAWDVPANIQIAMFEDRIELTSPGGLPFGINEEEYLDGYVSVPRNPIIANVFYRLNYIELFGTGVRRIQQAYDQLPMQPRFKVSGQSVRVILPVAQQNLQLSPDEELILQSLAPNQPLAKKELADMTGISSNRLSRLLRKLTDRHLLTKVGAGRGTKYYR
ncbi:ATP-binding protein [Lactobacillus delbrueckii]|uniref:ATP-binding protein n=1 Tax=Lactobacillus delbrueckii TaxID=1584 RepID=UPI0022E47766|nr:ATP-binding protein [Lactobacillus delbrueckii]